MVMPGTLHVLLLGHLGAPPSPLVFPHGRGARNPGWEFLLAPVVRKPEATARKPSTPNDVGA